MLNSNTLWNITSHVFITPHGELHAHSCTALHGQKMDKLCVRSELRKNSEQRERLSEKLELNLLENALTSILVVIYVFSNVL